MRLLKRKVYDELLEWKRNLAGKYALLLEGARRVGKTHILKKFAAEEYESSIFIDFSQNVDKVKEAKSAFDNARDIADLLVRLQIIFNASLVEGKSCLVFDEVQRFPKAREAIKHLVEYGKYHYIESGSLVGIRENVADIMIPSEEHSVKMHPLDFGEFLDAMEARMVREEIERAYEESRPVMREAHVRAIELLRLYMVVGGMPQSVLAYVESGDKGLENSEKAKREILDLYERDIGKYAKGYASKVREVFRQIPSTLNRHERKFKLSDIDKNARMRRYENAFLWLEDAMIANTARNSFNADLDIGLTLDGNSFKCYLLDTGLLVSMAMGRGRAVDTRILRGVLYDNLGINEGMFFENVVAQTLVANGDELRFYSRKDTVVPSNTMEIDFLVRRGIKICPIEVKSGRYHVHASLDRFADKFGSRLGRKYVVCIGEYEERNGVTYLPAYMAYLI